MCAKTLNLFEQEKNQGERDVEKAEKKLMDLADYIYGNTSLKPMSKALFAISRLMLVAKESEELADKKEIVTKYRELQECLGSAAPEDEYSLKSVLGESENHLDRIMGDIYDIYALTEQTDSLGLVFNTLLRGKWEAGEGLGTYLTPDEVVDSMVDMLFSSMSDREILDKINDDKQLFGDICAGTGRFVMKLTKKFKEIGVSKDIIEEAARLYDQSNLAINFARLNFIFSGYKPNFERVKDSLVDNNISDEKGRYLFLATNPPFGSSKYKGSERLKKSIKPSILKKLSNGGKELEFDPSSLFVFRNLDLLAPKGVLGIILPDGVIHSQSFKDALRTYEKTNDNFIEILSLVSLPSVTFQLGGTVAKTSYILLQKCEERTGAKMFISEAKNIGFEVSGNSRVPDPEGNDLKKITSDYEREESSQYNPNWRKWDRIGKKLKDSVQLQKDGEKVKELCISRRIRTEQNGDVHISVSDVDESAFIDIFSAKDNDPSTPGLKCESGDVLVSGINPRIWRVTVVPDLDNSWTCSPEFLVLRPKDDISSWELCIRMHHRKFIQSVQRTAGGTSSSRQRVDKEMVMNLVVPKVKYDEEFVNDHQKSRNDFYQLWLKESELYEQLHDGKDVFSY